MYSHHDVRTHINQVILVQLQRGVEVLKFIQVVDVARAVLVVLMLPEFIVGVCRTLSTVTHRRRLLENNKIPCPTCTQMLQVKGKTAYCKARQRLLERACMRRPNIAIKMIRVYCLIPAVLPLYDGHTSSSLSASLSMSSD